MHEFTAWGSGIAPAGRPSCCIGSVGPKPLPHKVQAAPARNAPTQVTIATPLTANADGAVAAGRIGAALLSTVPLKTSTFSGESVRVVQGIWKFTCNGET